MAPPATRMPHEKLFKQQQQHQKKKKTSEWKLQNKKIKKRLKKYAYTKLVNMK